MVNDYGFSSNRVILDKREGKRDVSLLFLRSFDRTCNLFEEVFKREKSLRSKTYF
jgi:hypothetical protein